jgi:Tol biopolymer transport system component
MSALLRLRHPLAIACFLCLLAAAPASAAFPGANGSIAFSEGAIIPDGGELSEHSQIFTIEPNGADLRQLTHVGKSQAAALPDWSPDGRRIAFESNRSGAFGIWVMNADGSGQTRLSGQEGFGDFYPSWSPDGNLILYSHCTEVAGFGFFSRCDIDSMNADGTGKKTLLSDGRWLNTRPQFSPNGEQIAFGSDRGGLQGAIWVMGADGSSPVRLTKPSLRAFWPDWAPSGDRILFSDHCCVEHSNLYTIRPDGSGLKKLTKVEPLSVDAAFAGYSPDGTEISFSYDKGCKERICESFYTANSDGSDFRQVSTGKADTLITDWGPEPVP